MPLKNKGKKKKKVKAKCLFDSWITIYNQFDLLSYLVFSISCHILADMLIFSLQNSIVRINLSIT